MTVNQSYRYKIIFAFIFSRFYFVCFPYNEFFLCLFKSFFFLNNLFVSSLTDEKNEFMKLLLLRFLSLF